MFTETKFCQGVKGAELQSDEKCLAFVQVVSPSVLTYLLLKSYFLVFMCSLTVCFLSKNSQSSSESKSRSVMPDSLWPHGLYWILQARILEWVAFPFSRRFSQPRDWTQVSHTAGGFFTCWATREHYFWSRLIELKETETLQWSWGTVHFFFFSPI